MRNKKGFGWLFFAVVLPALLHAYFNNSPSSPAADTPAQASESIGGSSAIPVFFSQVWDEVPRNKTNPNNIAAHCVQAIESAKKTLDVAGFEIDNKIIVEAIARASKRGVAVRVVTDTDYIKELGPETFRQLGIKVVSDQRPELMHNKFIIIDGARVWTGSFNLTENCAYKNNNNALIIDDPRIAANYAEKFHWFWDDHKFGGRPTKTAKIPNPFVKLADGTTIENYFSNHDSVDEHVVMAIRQARKSIKFMAFSFTHQRIAEAMIERARQGVKVAGVFETRQLSQYSMYEMMNHEPEVSVVLDGNKYNMHHKVIIIDDATVITGSYNFSASATKGNDENLVIIRNAEVARSYNEEFNRVYGFGVKTLAQQPAKPKR